VEWLVHSSVLRKKLIVEYFYMRKISTGFYVRVFIRVGNTIFFIVDFSILFLCCTGRPKTCYRILLHRCFQVSELIYRLLNYFTNNNTHCRQKQTVIWLKLKLNLIYDRQSVGQSVLVSGTHLGLATNFYFSLKFPLDSCGFVIL
jgi:hypothetical protein